MTCFLSPSPEVRLINTFARPLDNAVATARTCYSTKGIVTAEQVAGEMESEPEKRELRLARRDALAQSLYQAGHHTVFQHAHFQFTLSNVSRQFVWSFLHAHPFYNSEQVSQRYVAVREGAYAVPPLTGSALAVYRDTVEAQTASYHELTKRLEPVVARAYFARFRGRAQNPQAKGTANDIRKKCLEIARYVLPVATFTYLYHTISGLTLMRYHRLINEFDTPAEQRLVVGEMVAAVLRSAPELRVVFEDALPLEESVEYAYFAGRPSPAGQAFAREFDADLEGRVSRLVAYSPANEALLAGAVREILGLARNKMNDDEAIARVMDPARNRYLGEAMNVAAHTKLCRAMVHPHYVFRKKLSHTADSQDQRHRLTPASRPCLPAYLRGEPDYVTPAIVRQDPAIERSFAAIMQRSWEGIRRLQDLGVSDEFAAYLLPNAVSIRFTESADLMNLWHKHAMRLCYNAQEEIWRASKEEAEQIREVNPRIGKFLLPPCGLRQLAGSKPFCPEGPRYCGERVWKYDLSEYVRLI